MTTTPALVEKDAALARRFQPVLVPEPTVDDALAILRRLRDRYEAHHQVRYADEALLAAVELSDRYISDRFVPDRAIDLIDQAGARVRLRTKTPGNDLRELQRRADDLHRDKDQAIASEQYERASQLRDEIGDLRRRIEELEGDESVVPEVTVNDVAEVVSRATGVPVQQLTEEEEDAGQLTEAVRRRPYSVVLLDEIEKAHPDVFNILLQVLDDGRLTDAQGRTADFKNTVMIMTSNLGSDLITRGTGTLGFTGSAVDSADSRQASLRDQLMRRLRESFRPEFLNRIDEIIIFQQLDQAELRQITELMLEETRRRPHAQGLTLEFTPAAVDWIAEHGHQPEFGARPMRRVIQREVDNQLSRRQGRRPGRPPDLRQPGQRGQARCVRYWRLRRGDEGDHGERVRRT